MGNFISKNYIKLDEYIIRSQYKTPAEIQEKFDESAENTILLEHSRIKNLICTKI